MSERNRKINIKYLKYASYITINAGEKNNKCTEEKNGENERAFQSCPFNIIISSKRSCAEYDKKFQHNKDDPETQAQKLSARGQIERIES